MVWQISAPGGALGADTADAPVAAALPLAPSGAGSLTYLDWMRGEAARLRNPYTDVPVEGAGLALMRGRIQESHSDAATDQLTIQLCTMGDYDLVADMGAGRFRARRHAGDAVVGAPGSRLMLSGGSSAGLEITIAAIDRATVARLVEDATGHRDCDFGEVHARLVRDPTIDAVVRSAWNELSRRTAFTRLQADAVVQMLVATLLRLRGDHPRGEGGGLAPWQINRVMDLLAANYHRDVSVAELAGAVGLSRAHFSRAFRSATGVPPHRRQMEIRIEHAKRALSGGTDSLVEIALSVGYASQQAFTRAFQDMTGMSPGAFRRGNTALTAGTPDFGAPATAARHVLRPSRPG